MSADSHDVVKPKQMMPRARSRVSNGSATFIEAVDARSNLARRFRDVLADLNAHLGGEPTAAEALLARRAAALSTWCDLAEARLVREGEGAFDVLVFSTAANSLRRILSDLGLERRARDVTAPTLEAYGKHLEAAAGQ